MSSFSLDSIRQFLEKLQKNISDKDFSEILSSEKKIFGILDKNQPFNDLVDKVKLLFELIKDFVNGNYRDISYSNITFVAAVFLYILSPIDLIPDFIPVVGYADDAGVVIFALGRLVEEIDKYEAWRKNNTSTQTP